MVKGRLWTGWILFALTLALGLGALPLAVAIRDSPMHPYQEPVSAVIDAIATAAIGVFVLSRLPRQLIALLLCAFASSQALFTFSNVYAIYGSAHQSPLTAAMAWVGTWEWLPRVLLFVLVGLLFPDGRPLSPRWRWVVAAVVLGLTAQTVLFAAGSFPTRGPLLLGPDGQLFPNTGPLVGFAVKTLVLLPIVAIVTLTAVVLRYRRSRGVERLQLKWFVIAFGASAVVGSFNTLQSPLGIRDSFSGTLLTAASPFADIVIAGAIAVALLRYRLFDINVIIQRSLVYGMLASSVTVVYILIVAALGTALGSRGSGLGLSIVATVIVAAAFQPLRGRAEALANRLVYGERATPYELLSRFTRNLRETEAGGDVLARMTRLLTEGTGALRCEIWALRDGEPYRAASWPPELPAQPAVLASAADDGASIGHVGEVEISHDGQHLGHLTLEKRPDDAFTPREERLLADLAAQAGLVLRNQQLTSDLVLSLEELRASGARIVQAGDAERRRVERNLHDGAQQRLATLMLSLRMARTAAEHTGDEALVASIDEAGESLRQALVELRELAQGIHPAILTEAGLGAALESLAESSPVPVTLTSVPEERLPAGVEATAYYVVSEALANVAKHAHAASARVNVHRSDGSLVITVEDDGVGGADIAMGTGLGGLVDRTHALSGQLRVVSPRGRGTAVHVTIPCA
jgi:signal transduction histidine kinase